MANPFESAKPKWNMYDLDNNPEHKLFEQYVVEANDIGGIAIEYYIRDESIPMDRLYGESTNTEYLGPYDTKVTYEPTEEVTSTTPFGIVSEDMIQFAFIPKYTFSRDVSGGYNPKPADVIKTPWNDQVYEIVDVGEEAKIFQLKKMVWEFILKPYRHSDQSVSADMTLSTPLSAFGDNEFIEEESDSIDNYEDVDEGIYGY